jgi:hypothetical protein
MLIVWDAATEAFQAHFACSRGRKKRTPRRDTLTESLCERSYFSNSLKKLYKSFGDALHGRDVPSNLLPNREGETKANGNVSQIHKL